MNERIDKNRVEHKDDGCSVLESQEASNASFNPLRLWLIGWQLKVEDEVSRVTRGREGTITREHLVNRAIVDSGLRLDTVLHGQEVNHRHLDEELLWLTLV